MKNQREIEAVSHEMKLCTSYISRIGFRICFINKNDPILYPIESFTTHMSVYTQSRIFDYILQYRLSNPKFKEVYNDIINSYADSLIMLQPAVFLSADSIITIKDYNELLYLYNVLLLYYQGFTER